MFVQEDHKAEPQIACVQGLTMNHKEKWIKLQHSIFQYKIKSIPVTGADIPIYKDQLMICLVQKFGDWMW